MDLQKISEQAFIDELNKLASIGSLTRTTIMEMKGALPKGTAVRESQRMSQMAKSGRSSLFPLIRSSTAAKKLADPQIPSSIFG